MPNRSFAYDNFYVEDLFLKSVLASTEDNRNDVGKIKE
jgi:hypothetical protein